LNYLTQKVAYGAACANLGIRNSIHLNELNKPIVENGKLALGNLDISRDWGYAKDYVLAMWLSLQYKNPDDFVIGTGVSHSLKDLCEIAYGSVGINWREVVFSDPSLIRPIESVKTLANSKKANKYLKWQPKTCFSDMIKKMVNYQINLLK
jgi:GDPmannose 4,6-dehydratase